MPKFIIEREISGAGRLDAQALHEISCKSCDVLSDLGPEIQWVQSYVTDSKIFCVYLSPDEETIREHGRRGGFPVDRIERVRNVIDPVTAEV